MKGAMKIIIGETGKCSSIEVDGTPLRGVAAVEVSCRAGEPSHATLQLGLIKAEMSPSEIQWMCVDPFTPDGRLRLVKRIEFADGGVVEL